MFERTDNFIASLGLEAYRVGGSVRDEILGRKSKDADYVIRGIGLIELGKRLRDRRADYEKFDVRLLVLRDGRQAGWRVSGRGLGLAEIMLPRKEVSTGPGHRDFEIVIDPGLTLAEDAERRDFTFNALYLPVDDETADLPIRQRVSDPLGGLEDLMRRLVRTTHHDSFRDDPLRTLRALRFVSTLGYDLARDTYAEMVAHADAVTGLSAKGYASGTVLDELSRILMGDNVREALTIARDTGVLGTLIPELAPMLGFNQGSRYHDLTTDDHTFAALHTAAHIDAPLRVRMALLFHDAGKPETAWRGKDGRLHYYKTSAENWWGPEVPDCDEDHEVAGERIWRTTAERLNAPVRLREDVAALVRDHMLPLEGKRKESKVRLLRAKLGDDMLRDLLMHRACDVTGKGSGANKGHLDYIAWMEETRQKAVRERVPATNGDLEINGHDAIEAGLRGRDIGAALGSVLREVAAQPNERARSREWQVSRLEAMARERG